MTWYTLLIWAGSFVSALGGVVLALFSFKEPIIKILNSAIDRTFLKRNTSIVEEVRIDFNKSLEAYKKELNTSLEKYKKDLNFELAVQIEPLKSSLSRENIAFQIAHTEYIKRQFTHIEELYSLAYDTHKFTLSKLKPGIPLGENLVETMDEVYKKRNTLVEKINHSSFFLDIPSLNILTDYTNQLIDLADFYSILHSTLTAHKEIITSDERKQSQQIIIKERGEYITRRNELNKFFHTIPKNLKRLLASTVPN